MGNAEVLNLENGVNQSPSSPRGRYNQSSPQRQPRSIDQPTITRPYQDHRRAHSEMDLYQNKGDPTELYTTIGPDGNITIRGFMNFFLLRKQSQFSLLPACEVACRRQQGLIILIYALTYDFLKAAINKALGSI